MRRKRALDKIWLMCFFVTVAVPHTAVDAVRERHGVDGLCIDETRNTSAVSASGSGWTPLLFTGGGCSCGFYSRLRTADMTSKLKQAEAKYRKRGWSEGKIKRAIESMKREAHPNDGLQPAIVDVLLDIVNEHGAVKVWVHDFAGKLEVESYAIAEQHTWTTNELRERAHALELDVLITITPMPGAAN